MNLIHELFFPTLTGVLGGLGVFMFRRFYESQMPGEGGADYRQYSGIWWGLHVTADPKDGTPAYSEHEYNLKVRKSGQITGDFTDHVGDTPWNFVTTGQIHPGAVVMTHRCQQRADLTVVEMYKTGISPKLMVGMIMASTYDKDKHFASSIVLQKDKKVTPVDFRKMMKTQTTAFYGELNQTLGLPKQGK